MTSDLIDDGLCSQHYVNQAGRISAALGGVLTLWGTHLSLYKGSMEYLNIVLVTHSLTVQGDTITIDTGTTLIRAPTPIVATCHTNVVVHISFGGTNWAISPLDLNLGTLNNTMIDNANTTSQMCAGLLLLGFVGDTFLKNVYLVFRASPAAFGFAQLVSGLSSSTGFSNPNLVQEWELDQRQHKLWIWIFYQEYRYIAYSSSNQIHTSSDDV
ncbi:hypothetical protein EDB19DRAFT_2031062 [Suillus lakei]|nr:hypothetical protein EDB19DRAFT_2031062 [Suillus lakei]